VPAPRPAPSSVKVFYSEDMVSDSGVKLSPSDRKPKIVSEALLQTGWPIELVRPEPTSIADLCRVHDADFVDDVLELRRPNGFGSISESVSHSVRYTCGACYGSAIVALEEGLSASLTSGFHHAGPRVVQGFCTFNGLMVAAAQVLAEARAERVAIIDCDYHYGNGTQAILEARGLESQIMHVSFGQTYRKPEQASAYLAAVGGLRARLQDFRPQLILYQAGADTHVDDPFGGLLTTEQMRTRDRRMLTIARELSIPLAWNLAGGYQVESDGSIPRVVELHLNTFEEALSVWQML
jgi:acetoin utilization deacetylase AcuC-like enzyme